MNRWSHNTFKNLQANSKLLFIYITDNLDSQKEFTLSMCEFRTALNPLTDAEIKAAFKEISPLLTFSHDMQRVSIKPLKAAKTEVTLFSSAGVIISSKQVKKGTPILMRDSKEIDISFVEAKFKGTDYEIANLTYYHEAALSWSDKDGNKAIDWTATIRGFILRDVKAGCLVTNAHNGKKLKGIAGLTSILNEI